LDDVLSRSPAHQRAVHHAARSTERATPGDQALNSAYVVPDAFSVAQCGELRQMFDTSPAQAPAQVTSGLVSQRRSTMAPVDRHAQNSEWLTGRMAWLFAWANVHLYQFELTGLDEDFQLLRYEVGDFFTWHLDCGPGLESTRKLSMSIQLSAPADYEGGRLEFAVQARLPMSGLQGAAVIFPSYLTHRVSPLTRGARFSLVAWAHGPAFR
jgi:PKHD-type hydroxylase